MLLSYPKVRTFAAQALAKLIKDKYPAVNKIAGVATAGVAHGALVAHILDLPYAYVRPEPKKHGKGQQIEGIINSDDHVVLVEDLISTGKSSLKALNAVRSKCPNALGVVALFTYEFPEAEANFEKANCTYDTLGNYSSLLGYALEMGFIKAEELDLLNSWRKDPANWNNI